LWTSVTTRPKNWHILVEYLQIYWTDFQNFLPYESTLRAHDGSIPYFIIYQGSLPWQPNNVAKTLSTPTDTSCIHCTDAKNELQYHGLAERGKSANNTSILYENFVKFGPVTSELTVLICERQVRHSQKLAFFVEYLLIYWTHFRNLFTVWKCFTYRWWICTLFSNLSTK